MTKHVVPLSFTWSSTRIRILLPNYRLGIFIRLLNCLIENIKRKATKYEPNISFGVYTGQIYFFFCTTKEVHIHPILWLHISQVTRGYICQIKIRTEHLNTKAIARSNNQPESRTKNKEKTNKLPNWKVLIPTRYLNSQYSSPT